MTFSPDTNCSCDIQPAVNFGDRRGVEQPDILLLHYTGMDSAAGALKWLCAEESGVSCHYFVFEDGRIVQLVPEEKRAHHAGVSYWLGDRDINSRSIGIEIANPGHSVDEGVDLPDFPADQMEAVAKLCQDIIARHNIPSELVLAHSDVAPARKQDPGENFDWGWLAHQGVGLWSPPAEIRSGRYFQRGDSGEPIAALQAMLKLFGYEVDATELFDERTYLAVVAFQRHYRQKIVDGVADLSTIETLHNLLTLTRS